MEKETRTLTETNYNIEVDHERRIFEEDMDFLTREPKKAYEHYLKVSKKYSGQQITITCITTKVTLQHLSPSELEDLAKSN